MTNVTDSIRNRDRLIFAMDVPETDQARELADRLGRLGDVL